MNINNKSETFKLFFQHYITGNPMIRDRGEEDLSVWMKLNDNELEEAKQIIMDKLTEKPDSSYIKAIGIFRDERAIPILKNILLVDSNEYIMEKLRAAKVLYDWIGNDEYIKLLKKTCLNATGSLQVYLQLSIKEFINNLNETDIKEIMNYLFET